MSVSTIRALAIGTCVAVGSGVGRFRRSCRPMSSAPRWATSAASVISPPSEFVEHCCELGPIGLRERIAIRGLATRPDAPGEIAQVLRVELAAEVVADHENLVAGLRILGEKQVDL